MSLNVEEMSKDETIELFDALHLILIESAPHALQIECLAEFCKDLLDKDWDGDYNRAANRALVEWDI